MELQIEILTGESCYFECNDLTEYLAEESEQIGLKYSDTVSIICLNLHNSKTNEIKHLKPIFTKSKHNIVPTKFNGYFDFIYLVIPTKDWVDKQSDLSKYTEVYYVYNDRVYKDGQEITDISNIPSIGTNILKVLEGLISICYIKKYFVELCKQIYNNRLFNKCNIDNKPNSDLIGKRDLIWTFINLISYYTDIGYLYEALRLIDLLLDCININVNNCNKCL